MENEKDFWDCKDQLKTRYAELEIELGGARMYFHSRVDQLVDCKHKENIERLQESCEFWAGDIAQLRAMMFDIEDRISELEKVNINVSREVA